jgi:hypothetical protein
MIVLFVVLGESKKYNETLAGQNEELSKVVEKAANWLLLIQEVQHLR